jgi:hypothetical protein
MQGYKLSRLKEEAGRVKDKAANGSDLTPSLLFPLVAQSHLDIYETR